MGGGGPGGPDPPFLYEDDVMHTVAFCMLLSLDLQDCTSF